MTPKNIIDILEEFEMSDIGHQDTDALEELKTRVGHFDVVGEYGGEGKGAEWWIVYHFTLHNVYIRLNAYYESNCGVEFESYEEVVPKTVTVTKYVPVGELDSTPVSGEDINYEEDDSEYFNDSEN